MTPLVSAVITTRDRPEAVARAARSALKQTLSEIELIVVMDGLCQRTRQELAAIKDQRLVIRTMDRSYGQAAAINRGVASSKGKWIALLDDDDEWLADKLQIQFDCAERSSDPHPVLATRFIARAKEGEYLWPRRLPNPNENLSEYLCCQSGLLAGEGMVLPSTTMASRALLLDVPMTEGLKRHVDLDWLLRVQQRPGVNISFVAPEKPLAVYSINTQTARVSNSADWRYSLAWAHERRHLMTPRARAGFSLLIAGPTACRAGDWRAFPFLLAESFRCGRPRAMEIAAYLSIWLIPISLRRAITRSNSWANQKT